MLQAYNALSFRMSFCRKPKLVDFTSRGADCSPRARALKGDQGLPNKTRKCGFMQSFNKYFLRGGHTHCGPVISRPSFHSKYKTSQLLFSEHYKDYSVFRFKSIVVNMDMGREHLLLDAQLIVKIIIIMYIFSMEIKHFVQKKKKNNN